MNDEAMCKLFSSDEYENKTIIFVLSLPKIRAGRANNARLLEIPAQGGSGTPADRTI